MIDPDAPQRDHEVAGPWLHWIKSSLKRNDVHNGKTLGTYCFYPSATLSIIY